jgi:hypothetical protein
MTPLRLLAGLALLGPAAACASVGSSSPAAALLITLRDYKAGQRFELASESHTDRVRYYSDARIEAVRKVQTDEVMTAFLRELERQGLGQHARAGPAPEVGGEVIRWGLEVEGHTGTLHWLVGTGSSPEDWRAFQGCRDMFLQLYNSTVSFQAVRNESGKRYFEEQARAHGGRTRSP